MGQEGLPPDTGLLIIRLVIGLTVAAHGARRLFGLFGGRGIDATARSLIEHGFPHARAQAHGFGVGELGGGLFVALGLLTPMAAAVIVAVMFVALGSVHAGKGFFLGGGGCEYYVVLGGVASGLAFTGPGTLSIDGAFGVVWGPWWRTSSLVFGLAAALLALATRYAVDTPRAASQQPL